MRQTAAHRPYVGSAGVLSRHGQSAAYSRTRGRSGFTLIEVTVALAIFMIVILALISSYFGYNSRMRALRIATIGQNLAQLEMENLRSMSKSVLKALAAGVSTDVNYVNTPSDAATDGFPVRLDQFASDDLLYDSGVNDGTFYIPNIRSINLHEPSSASDVPALTLPEGIVTISVADHTTWLDYTVILHKGVFPGYQKRIVVRDIGTGGSGQLFRLEVTVFWEVGGRPQQFEVTSEK